MNYAVVENGVVVNTIVWDGDAWTSPIGSTAIPIPDGAYVGIGSTYANGTFGPPPQPAPMV